MALTWKSIKIADLGRVVTGKTPSTAKPHLYGENYPFITPTDIDSLRYCVPTRFLSEEGRESQRNILLPAKSVCVTCIASVGKMCMTNRPSFTNQQINSVIVDEAQHDPFFIFYLLKTKVEHLKAIAGGVATPIINKTTFSEVEVSVPPLPTQRRIASILSAYDDLIENNTRRIAVLEEIARRVYVEWFVHFRFPGHEQVKMVESELGGIPQGWTAESVASVVQRLPAGQTYKKDRVFDQGHVMVVDQSTTDYLGFHDSDVDHPASVDEPRMIFGDHTCKLKLMLQPFSVGPNTIPFIGAKGLDSIYVFQLVRGLVETREYKRHWSDFSDKKVIVCTVELAARYGNSVRSLLNLALVLGNKNRNLRSTRDLLLPKLISGELEVSEIAA